VRDETIIADCYELADKGVGLNPAPFADSHFTLYLNKWTNETSISNSATIEIDWLYDRHVFPKLDIDNSDRPKRGSVHNFSSQHPFELKGRARSRLRQGSGVASSAVRKD
jgi:hypothetical protein